MTKRPASLSAYSRAVAVDFTSGRPATPGGGGTGVKVDGEAHAHFAGAVPGTAVPEVELAVTAVAEVDGAPAWIPVEGELPQPTPDSTRPSDIDTTAHPGRVRRAA